MLQRIVGLAALCLLLLPLQAQAQSLKIGYTDPEPILQRMPEYRQVQETLQKEYQTDQQAFQAMFQDYQEKLDRYQKQQALLSEERRAEREKELISLQQDLQQAEVKSQQKLAQREQELLAPLFDKMQGAIDEIARQKGIDIVLRAPAILYVNENTIVDITPDVAQKMGLSLEGQASN